MSQLGMFQLTEIDQKLLLQIARNSVLAHLTGQNPDLPEILPGVLTEFRGTFVSIHKHRELRGCIGNLYPAGPLYQSISECSISAATRDPRFPCLAAEELSEVDFEISVLSPMRRVEDIAEIEIGKHGLLISKRSRRGLLLPQVAAAFGWDRATFLQETCRKAGLKPDDWKMDAAIHCFSAVVFGERQFHSTAAS